MIPGTHNRQITLVCELLNYNTFPTYFAPMELVVFCRTLFRNSLQHTSHSIWLTLWLTPRFTILVHSTGLARPFFEDRTGISSLCSVLALTNPSLLSNPCTDSDASVTSFTVLSIPECEHRHSAASGAKLLAATPPPYSCGTSSQVPWPPPS